MDPVDVIRLSEVAAQAIRSASDPVATLVGAYEWLGREPPAGRDEPVAIRVVRLMHEAGEERQDVLAYLRTQAGPLFLNRNEESLWGRPRGEADRTEPDPEATRLVALLDENQAEGYPMMGPEFGPFEVAGRKVVAWFDEDLCLLRREGQRDQRWFHPGFVVPAEALHGLELDPLPATVRGLITNPLEVPALFPIETGESPWSLWDICCAFADQYARIYEQPDRYGVWGHDITDLWIERLEYYPAERLIDAWVGS